MKPKRRRLILAGSGMLAAAAGAGWQLTRGAHADDVAEQLWALRFPKPDGSELVMASLRGKPLLLNFWATWCAPCVKEMPELDRFAQAFAARGWQVVGLAVDNAKPVREFLQHNPVGFLIGLAGFEGAELTGQLGNAQGALPFTAVFDRRGRIVQRKLGPSDYAELVRWGESI